jgi:hypothetical protein
MRSLSRLFFAAFVALLLTSTPAAAFTVSLVGAPAGGNPGDLCGELGGTTCRPYYEVSGLNAGDSFDMAWDLDGTEILGPDLVPDFPTISATGTLSVTSITATTVLLDITLNNTTNPADNTACSSEIEPCPEFMGGIVAFGMLMEDFVSGVLSTPGTSLDTYGTNNIAGGPGLEVDFCASTDGTCNAGSANDSILTGESDSFQFTLTGVFDLEEGITLANFATKWQTNYDDMVVPDDPAVLDGNSSFEQPGLPGEVPEPSTGLLIAIGFTLMVAVRSSKG